MNITNDNLRTLLLSAQEALENFECGDAKKIMKQIQAFALSRNLRQVNPALYAELQPLLTKLKVLAFPALSDEDAAEVLKNHYLVSYDIDVSMQDYLAAKLFTVPYLVRDDLRKLLKEALVNNVERLGPSTIGQWIGAYESLFDVKTRDLSATSQFILEYPSASELNKIELSRLLDILKTYDMLLLVALPVTNPNLYKAFSSESSQSNLEASSSPANYTHIILSEALKDYPDLGEQLITSQKINLRSFPYPVRPSIKNWLADYTSLLGYESHGSMARSQYIFQGANAKNLSEQDKNRLAYILKAFDENSPITLNKNTSQIICQIILLSPQVLF